MRIFDHTVFKLNSEIYPRLPLTVSYLSNPVTFISHMYLTCGNVHGYFMHNSFLMTHSLWNIYTTHQKSSLLIPSRLQNNLKLDSWFSSNVSRTFNLIRMYVHHTLLHLQPTKCIFLLSLYSVLYLSNNNNNNVVLPVILTSMHILSFCYESRLLSNKYNIMSICCLGYLPVNYSKSHSLSYEITYTTRSSRHVITEGHNVCSDRLELWTKTKMLSPTFEGDWSLSGFEYLAFHSGKEFDKGTVQCVWKRLKVMNSVNIMFLFYG